MIKEVLFYLVVLCGTTYQLEAQSARYVATMEKNLSMLDTARNMNTLTKLSNTFERIAQAETEEWLPNYYAAYAHFRLATVYVQQEDMANCLAHIDKAQEALDQAIALEGQHSELLALQGLIYQGRIWENPMVKGAEYSPKSHAVLDQAIALDPNNPRAYFLKGQNVFYTPEFFGGGAENAKPLLEKAAALFASTKAESSIAPNWGEKTNTYLLSSANEKLNKDATKN